MSKDDIAVKDEEVTDASAAESAPEETEQSEVVDEDFEKVKDLPLDPSESPETEDEAAEQPNVEETESDPPKGEEPSLKEEWDNLNGKSQDKFRQAINERNDLRRQMEELQAKQAQFATEQDLVNEINPETGVEYTPQEIERISWLQSREAQAERTNQELYGLQVQQNQQAIDDEVAQVKDIPLFNPEGKDFNQEQFNRYMDVLSDNLVYQLPDGRQFNRSTLVANGINPEQQATLVGTNTSPLKLAKLIADPYTEAKKQGEVVGQANAQRATDKMLANADEPSSAPSRSNGDSLDALFDRVKDVQLS
jgi:hypothetical protein